MWTMLGSVGLVSGRESRGHARMVVRVAAVVLAVAAPADALRRGFHRAMSGTTMLAVWFSPDRNTSIVARLTPSFFPPRAVRDQASPATGERHAHGRRSAGATVQLRPRQPRCTNTTVDLDVTWTGEGPISRDAQTSPRQEDVIIEDAHFVGQSRAATATGQLDGRSLGAANFALFGTRGAARSLSATAQTSSSVRGSRHGAGATLKEDLQTPATPIVSRRHGHQEHPMSP